MTFSGRRGFLQGTGLGLLAFQVGGASLLLSPREAHARNLPLRALSSAEAATVQALGETLLPGATAAGLVHYLDQQLAAAPADSLLMIRYLDVPPPYLAFYRPCLAAVDAVVAKRHGKHFSALEAAERDALVGELQARNPDGWEGPPAPLFYFVLRNDAVDVVYGTPEGFARLGVPYMQHILPPSNW